MGLWDRIPVGASLYFLSAWRGFWRANCGCRGGVFRDGVRGAFRGGAGDVRDEGAGVEAGDQVEVLMGRDAVVGGSIRQDNI